MTGQPLRLPFPPEPTRPPRTPEEEQALRVFRTSHAALISANEEADSLADRLQSVRTTMTIAQQHLANVIGRDAVELDGVVYRCIAGCITVEHLGESHA